MVFSSGIFIKGDEACQDQGQLDQDDIKGDVLDDLRGHRVDAKDDAGQEGCGGILSYQIDEYEEQKTVYIKEAYIEDIKRQWELYKME
jgi:hypothetical protein